MALFKGTQEGWESKIQFSQSDYDSSKTPILPIMIVTGASKAALVYLSYLTIRYFALSILRCNILHDLQ